MDTSGTRSFENFATADFPLHASSVVSLLQCPWRVTMEHLEPEDNHGTAGDTGSAVHRAAAAFHLGKDTAESLGVMAASVHEYPMADLRDAADLFLKYSSDPRNRDITFALVEGQVEFTIVAAPEDPTGAPVSMVGRVDQVRLHSDGKYRVWDIKTSKKDPASVLNESVFQLAAYCVGASILLDRIVEPGGVIMPRLYGADTSTSPVFRCAPWTFRDVEQILSPVRHIVAAVRSGRVYHVPNPGCCWCAFHTPDLCLPELKEFRSRFDSRGI
jgi:PD-(D/E)XK nuclease superfamily